MSKPIRLFSYLVLVLLLTNLFVGYRVHSAISKESGEDQGYKMLRKFANVLKLIRKNYVDDSKISYEDLVDGALQGMLSSLDKFSSYIEPSDYEKMKEETEGEFGGIGVVISVKDNILTVIAPMEDSPGMKAGIVANDEIIKIDGQDATQLSLDQAVSLIKGKPGTTVEITVHRPSLDEIRTLTVERGLIELKTVKGVHFVEPTIGYARITQFNEKTADTLAEKLKPLSEEGMSSLILDLRNNPGGLLTSAIEVSSLFIPRRQLIVFTEGRRESNKQEFKSVPGSKYLDFPIVILINEGSASAAEIVTGCLQDYDRALIVGEKSFGKGSVQSIIEVDQGSAIRLTTAKYYTPSERVIHEIGIEPDFVVDISDEDSQKLAMQRSRLKGAVYDEEFEDIKDPQIGKGIEILKGLLVMTDEKKKDYAQVIKSMSEREKELEPITK